MELYWVLRLPYLQDLFGLLAVIAIVSAMFSLVSENYDLCVLAAILFVIFLFISCMIPSRADLAIMYGWEAMHSKDAAEILNLIKEQLK